jgi:hypothetical protein
MERGSFGAGLRCRTQTRSLRILASQARLELGPHRSSSLPRIEVPAFSASPCTKTSLAIRKFLSRIALNDIKDKKSLVNWITPRLFVCEVFGGPERNAGEVPKSGSFFVFLLLFGVVSVNGVFGEITLGGGAAGAQAGEQKQRECLWPAHGVRVGKSR